MNDKLSQLSSLTVYHLQKHWPKDDYIKEMDVNTQNVIVLIKKKVTMNTPSMLSIT